jgi:hypothetical protein
VESLRVAWKRMERTVVPLKHIDCTQSHEIRRYIFLMQHMMYDARWPGIPPSVWKEAKMKSHPNTDIIQSLTLRPGDAQTPNIKPNDPRETRIVLSSRERTVNTTNTHMIRSTIQTKPDRKEKQSTNRILTKRNQNGMIHCTHRIDLRCL